MLKQPSKPNRKAFFLTTQGVLSVIYGEWRSGQFTLPTLCMVFVLFALLLTQGLTGELTKTISTETNQFLSADATLTTPYAIPKDLRSELQQYPIEWAETIETTTVILANQRTLLVALKAVDANYPIKPGLKLFSIHEPNRSQLALKGPNKGEAWIDPAVLDRLGLRIGDTLSVGHHTLTLSRIIEFEPDRSFRFYSLNPRIMIAIEDLEKTKIIQPASRATYRLLMGGQPDAISKLIEDVGPTLNTHQSLKPASESNPLIKRSVTRANNFLLIVGGLAAGISLAGFWLVLDRVSRRMAPTIATLRCLGSSKIQLSSILFGALCAMILVSLICVLPLCTLILFAGSQLSIMLEGPVITTDLSQFINPIAFAGSLLVIIGLGWLKLNALLNIPPAAAVQAHWLNQSTRHSASQNRVETQKGVIPSWFLPIVMVLSGAILYIVPITIELKKIVQLLFGGAITVSFAFLIAHLLTQFFWRKLAERDLTWELTLAQWMSLSKLNHFQVALFSIIVMGGAVTYILKDDLFDRWQKELPAETPNYFISNLFLEDIDPLKNLFAMRNINSSEIYPIVRGRLIKINQEVIHDPVTKEASRGGASENALRRELNLTWSALIPEKNEIIEGRWWQQQDSGKPLVSVESELADSLSIEVGDSLTFSLAGEVIDTEVVSIRTVEWDSFTPNFYVIFAPEFFDNETASFMASLYLPPGSDADHIHYLPEVPSAHTETSSVEANIEDTARVNIRPVPTQIAEQFPHITLYAVGPILEQIRTILGYVAGALTSALFFLTIAGTLLLIAMIFSSWDERQKTLSVIHIIGGSSKTISAITLREYMILAVSVAGIGCMGGELIAAVLSYKVFDISPTLHPAIWIIGIPWTLALFIGIGFIASRMIKKSHSTIR